MAATRGKFLKLLSLTCFIICALGWGSKPAEPSIGELEPVDPDVCTTQNITFTSSLLIPPKANFYIGFEIKNGGKYVAVDRDRVIEVNENVSQFTVYNITLRTEDIAKPLYFHVRSFYLEGFGNSSTSNKLKIGEEPTVIRVYPIPEIVKDFKCIVINYMSMNCSWNYGKKYGEDNMPNVKFLWRKPTHTGSWTPCKYLDKENGYCIWNESEAGYFQTSNITIKITLEQKCGVNVSSEFHIDTGKIVKPNPVSRISSYVINSTCVQVSWEAMDSEPQNPKEHRIIVLRDREPITNKTIFTTLETERLVHNWTFCDLHPYTKYEINAAVKPIGIYSGYFSEPRYTEAMTYSDKPSASPEVTEGGYNWNLRDCEGNSNNRRVCIFMKSIKEEDTNGPMKGLQGRFTAVSGNGPTFTSVSGNDKSVTNDWAEYVTYGCTTLLCTTSYNFTVKARNVNGTSDTPSTLFIPAFTSGIERPQIVVESSDLSKVYVSWDYRSKSNATGFLVVWCRNENGDCQSDHEVYWKRYPANTKEAVLQINSSAQDFLYGVIVLTEQGSSGGELQNCVYLKDTSPTRKPENVIVSEGSEYNTLVVTWDKLTCGYDQPYIDKYNLQYKKVNDISSKSINVSQSGEARVVLRDLEEDQTYTVTLRAVTRDGRFGPETEPITGVPINKELKPSHIAGITMAVLVVLIFAGVGIAWAVRRCKKKTQKAIKDAGAITIPDGPVQNTNTLIQRQNSNDSGCGLTPPPDKSRKAIQLSDSSLELPYSYRCATVGNIEVGSTMINTSNLEPSHPDGADTPDFSKETTDVTAQNTRGLILEIPKPAAFVSKSQNDKILSRRGNNATKDISKVGNSLDYVLCNSASFDPVGKSQKDFPALALTEMKSYNLPTNASLSDSEEQESKTDIVDYLPNAQSLTNTTSPMQMGGNDAAVIDENDFPLTRTENFFQEKDIPSSTLALQTPVQNPNNPSKNTEFFINATFESDETSTKNNLGGSSNGVRSSYVTTTEAAKLFPQNPSDTSRKAGTVHDKNFAEASTKSSGGENVILSKSVPQAVLSASEVQTSTGSSTIQNQIDNSVCALKHNAALENTGGYIPHSYAGESEQACDSVSEHIQTKNTFPDANITSGYVPFQDALSLTCPSIMEKVSDQNITPTSCTLNKNVNLGYVSSMEAVCQANESKFQPGDRNSLQAKQEDNYTSHTDSILSCPLTGPVSRTEQTNASPEAAEGKDNPLFQGYVTDVFAQGLEKEILNLKQDVDTERGKTSLGIQMNKNGYITHSSLQ